MTMPTQQPNYRLLVVLTGLLLLCSCANKTLKYCENIIWREEGKTAALSGSTKEQFNQIQKMCKPYKIPINKAAFVDGFDLGSSLFCQKGRGYVFGKKGAIYQGTCPKKSEKEFLSGYFRGRITHLEDKQSEIRDLLKQSEDRVWRKEKDYLVEATQDLDRAEQELDLLESYREEKNYLTLESKKIKLELIQLKKKQAELSF